MKRQPKYHWEYANIADRYRRVPNDNVGKEIAALSQAIKLAPTDKLKGEYLCQRGLAMRGASISLSNEAIGISLKNRRQSNSPQELLKAKETFKRALQCLNAAAKDFGKASSLDWTKDNMPDDNYWYHKAYVKYLAWERTIEFSKTDANMLSDLAKKNLNYTELSSIVNDLNCAATYLTRVRPEAERSLDLYYILQVYIDIVEEFKQVWSKIEPNQQVVCAKFLQTTVMEKGLDIAAARGRFYPSEINSSTLQRGEELKEWLKTQIGNKINSKVKYSEHGKLSHWKQNQKRGKTDNERDLTKEPPHPNDF